MQDKDVTSMGGIRDANKRGTKLKQVIPVFSKPSEKGCFSTQEDNVWENLINSVSDWIMLTDTEGKILQTNKTGERFTNISAEKIIGQNCCKLIFGSGKKLPDCPLTKMLETGMMAEKEFQLPTNKRWVTIRANPVTDSEGKIIKAACILRDVTEQKQTRDILIESERKFKSIFDSANDIIVFVTKSGKILEVNNKIKNILGYQPNELIGKNFLTCGILAMRNASLIIKLFTESVIRGGFPDKNSNLDITNVWLNHKDGHVVEVEASTTPIRKNGKLEGFVSILRDVSERKKTEQEISELKNFYKLILNNVHDGILVTDQNDRIIYINPGMKKIVDVKYKDVFGLDITKDFLPETTSEFLQFYYKAKSSLKCQEYEANVVTPSGRKTIQSGWLIPIIKDKKYDGMICTIQDITERKKAEAELKSSQTKLSEALKITKLGYWEFDVAEKMFTFNDQFYSVYRTSAEKVSGYKMSPKRYLEIFLYPEDAQIFYDMMQKLAEEPILPDSIHGEHRLRFGDGKSGYVSVNFFVIKDDKGRITKIYGANQDITERKRNEEALRLSEEKFRSVVENAREGIMVIQDKERVYCNPRWLEIVGYSAEEYETIPFLSRIHPEDLDFLIKIHAKLRNLETIKSNFAFRLITKSNEIKNITVRASYIQWENKPAELVILEDITERKSAEESLRISEIRYRELFENMPSGVAVYEVIDGGRDFVFKDFNRSGEQYDKQSREELIGKSIFDVRPGVKEFGLIDAFRKAIKTGKTVHHPIKLYKDEHLSAWYDNNIYLLPSGELVTIFRDVTQTKKAEEALKKNEEKLRLMAETIEDVFWLSTPDVKEMIYISPSYEKIWGKSCQSLYDNPKSFLDVVHPDDYCSLLDIINKSRISAVQYTCEYRIISPEGKLKWIFERGFPVYDDFGNLRYMTGICTDITSRKQIQNVLQENERLLNDVGQIAKIGGWERNLITKKGKWTKAKYDILEIDYNKPVPDIDEYIKYFLPEYQPIVIKAIKRLVQDNIPMDVEAKLQTAKGNIIWCRSVGRAIRKDGVCVKVFGAFQDVTERKKIEESILEYQKQLKSLASQLTLTEEKERYRIATALHDQISQYLAVSRMKIDELIDLIDSEEKQTLLEQVSQWLYHAIEETRSLTSDLSSPILYELGFERAVAAWLHDEVRQKHKIETEFHNDYLPKPLDDDIRILLFRNVRELLFNVIKHAHARKVKVSINRIDININIKVEDDGVGFDPSEVAATATGHARFGLFSIRERLEQFGGHLQIDSAPGKGSVITLIAPLKIG